jgi:dihydroorotate dehydrogenase (NAD+) catalytic subunit
MSDISVKLAGLELKNPVIPASGTFAYGYEMTRFYDINVLGGIAIKAATLEPRCGNPLPRVAECRSGMLNAIGLQNPGVKGIIDHELPRLRRLYKGVVIANIAGFTLEEYAAVASELDQQEGIDILEVNISCPNVQHGGMAFGVTKEGAAAVCKAVKDVCHKPVFMKLSPNVTDIGEIACACEDSGADGLTMINTLLGMVVDTRTGRPIVSTKMAGLSGPAIKPVALRMVYQAYERVKIPIIGVGGITCADDVIEMLSVGASAVQVGSQTLVDPWACKKIIEELPEKMDRYGIQSLSGIIGRSHK